jgi:methylmalonyl-CoA mutase N-terminal domain/subunit
VKDETQEDLDLLKIGREIERDQARSVQDVRATRDNSVVQRSLEELRRACANENVNVMPPLIDAVKALATEGEIVQAMVEVYGRYTERAAF